MIVETALSLDPELLVRSAPSGTHALEELGKGLQPDLLLVDQLLLPARWRASPVTIRRAGA